MVRTIQTATPRAELREFVQVYAQREIGCDGTEFSQPNTAALEQGIGFHFDGKTILNYPDGRSRLAPKAYVFGGLTPPCGGASFAGHVLAFAAFSEAALVVAAIPDTFKKILVNKDYDAEDLLGVEVLNLWSKMAACHTFQQRVHSMEEYLLPFAIRACGRTLIAKTAQHMLGLKGAVRIDDVAYDAALGVRQYERRFMEEVGMTPKLFARTARYQKALDAKRLSLGRSWLSVAHEFGYFDQMHMVRDFQLLGGHAPNEVLQQSGDIQPWSLGSFQTLELR